MAQEVVIPQHIAIVPDGNRRWAKLRGLPVLEGHRRGAEVMHNVVDELVQLGAKYLTLWGFSTDNWKRSGDEIDSLLHLLQTWIDRDTPWLHSQGVRLRHLGRPHQLPQGLAESIRRAVALTQDNKRMTLNLAFNYTGRTEIVDAVCRLIKDFYHEMCQRCMAGKAPPYMTDIVRGIDEKLFSSYLYTDGMPDVDLVIRTADELRLSNFMLWQTAYSELYFTDVLWPDFDTTDLKNALEAYTQRQRRFGGD